MIKVNSTIADKMYNRFLLMFFVILITAAILNDKKFSSHMHSLKYNKHVS
jgi:hypothetical protein